MRKRSLTPHLAFLLAFVAVLSACDPDVPPSQPAANPGPTAEVTSESEKTAVTPVVEETKQPPMPRNPVAEPSTGPAKPAVARPIPPPKEPPAAAKPPAEPAEPDPSAGAEKKAAALLELSREFLENGDKKQAKFWLDHVQKEFPETPSAKQAAALLKGLK